MFGVENLQDKRQPSKRHTESYPRIARSRKKQRKPERDWRIECAQSLLTIFACAKHLAYGSNVRKCSFQHHDHDELSYHGQTCTFLGTDLAPWTKYNGGKTTPCRIPIMKMRSGPPRPHSTLKTWQTKRQIWAFDFQPGVICVDNNKEKCSSNLFVMMQAPTLQAMLDEGFNAALDTAVGALDWFERIETMMIHQWSSAARDHNLLKMQVSIVVNCSHFIVVCLGRAQMISICHSVSAGTESGTLYLCGF